MESARRTKKSKWTKRFLAWLAGTLGPWLLRGLRLTWRIRREQTQHFQARGKDGQLPVYTMWHQNVPAGSAGHLGEPLSVLISSHRDGEIIDRTVRRMGFRSVRGSSSRGGARAMREMLASDDPRWGIVMTPDGPRGPRHSVAPGAIYLAAATGRPLVATGFAARRYWTLKSWDRMEFPKPFTRVAIAYDEPLYFDPEDLRDPEGLEQALQQLAASLHRAEDRAAHALNEEQK